MEKKIYRKLADAHAPKSPLLKNAFNAFWTGGLICVLGEGLRTLYERAAHLPAAEVGTLTSVTLIFLSALLSGIGVYDRIARLAGAGTLVPITGFANAVVSPAIDSHAEGLLLGVGAKIFSVAGPVLLYGTLSGTVYGVIYFLATKI